MSLVNRAISSCVPLVAELADVQVDDVAVEAVAQVEQRQVDDAADQRLLAELEERP